MGELKEVLIAGAILILPVIAGILAQYLRLYLGKLQEKVENEIGESNLHLILYYVETLIRAAEQQLGLEGDEAKKQFVFQHLRELADYLSFDISDTQLDAMIEGVYNRIKEEFSSDDPESGENFENSEV